MEVKKVKECEKVKKRCRKLLSDEEEISEDDDEEEEVFRDDSKDSDFE